MIMILTVTGTHAMCKRTPPDTVHSLVDTTILDIIKSKDLEIGERSMSSVINYKCYEYEDYVILVRSQLFEAEGEIRAKVGEEILIRYKDENLTNKAMCEWPHEGDHFRIVEWAGYFDGLFGKYVLVEQGTAPSPRLFSIFDLEKQEKIYTATYEVGGPIRIDEYYILTFNKMLDKQINTVEDCEAYREECPEIDELKRCITEMGGIGLYERVIVNLETLVEERTGEISCGCLQ